MLQIPMECKRDENGILYIDKDYIKKYPLNLNKDTDKKNLSFFYELLTTSDYIVKYNSNINNRKAMEMLLKFMKYQCLIKKTDFPIGYYKEDNNISGLIVPYYRNCPSLYDINSTHELGELSKYYYHDDDGIHNLYLLYLDILDIIEELYNNGIYYTDIHKGNFIFNNNEVKLIDFDPDYVFFKDNKKHYIHYNIMCWCENLLFVLMKEFNLADLAIRRVNDFDKMRVYAKKIENRVRKNNF